MNTTHAPALVVLDGGAHMGSVHPGALSSLDETGIDIFGYAGISIGSLMAAFKCNNKTQDEMRFLMEHDFANGEDMKRSLLPPIFSPKRMIFGGLADQVPVMRKLVSKYSLEPQENLFPLAFDLETRRLFQFEGDYDLAKALAAACSPWPAARPVEYRDGSGKMHYLVDALAYLLHKERLFPDNPAVIMRLFPVARRQPAADETAVMIGYPNGKIVRRVTPTEYDRYWQHGYSTMNTSLTEALQRGALPLL